MINWTMLAANSLWIVGLSVLLAAFSYRSYLKSIYKPLAKATGQPVDVSGAEPFLRLGMGLFVLGQVAVSFLSEEAWWRILLWAVLLILLLIEPGIALWRNRADLLARYGRGSGGEESLDPHTVADRWKVVGVLLIALIQGSIYLAALPPWQHYDEPSHFETAWLLAHTDAATVSAADRDTTFNRETAASMTANDFYWNLPKPDLLTDQPYGLGFPQYENRPLYYRLAGIPLGLFSHLDLVSQLYLARMVSLLFFLLAIGSAAGAMATLLVPGHPLRWAVPLSMALLPPFVDIMTAVNNDAGAFALFTLFLWGSVRMIRRGISPFLGLWVVGAGILSFVMKNTALISLPLIPVAFVLAWWQQQRWPWRWLGLTVVMAGILGMTVSLQRTDARYWYHWDAWGTRTIQTQPSRQRTAATSLQAAVNAPVGDFAAAVTVDPAAKYYRLLNPLPADAMQAMAGQTVTIGGWFWVDTQLDEPLTVAGPKLLWSESGTQSFDSNTDPIAVTSAPTFHAVTVQVPASAGVSYFALFGDPGNAALASPVQLLVDGAVVVLGEYPTDDPPLFNDAQAEGGAWGGQPFENLLRNGSAAQSWPRIRPQVENLIFRAAERSPTLILNGLLDWQRNGRLLTVTIPRHLITGLLGTFAWGHVRLEGDFLLPLYWIILGLSLAGTGWWVVRMGRQSLRSSKRRRRRASAAAAAGDSGQRGTSGRRRRSRHRDRGVEGAIPGVVFLGISGFLVWTNAVLWVLTFMWIARFGLPSTRYTFPAALPTVLLTVAGIAALASANRRVQNWVIYGVVAAFALLNIAALLRISEFYSTLPV